MKTHLHHLIAQALQQLQREGVLVDVDPSSIPLERTRDRTHGDFASTIALALAKTARRKPRELAERIMAALPPSAHVAKVDIAGPGFINFFLA
ncbi:MAG: arginine--tRNA ligase, partial [Candidatus Competibacteraceae bacterium]|nr:arginine--tRNA ligase [Candidatus Competibacteraceae bacterium]